MPETSTPLSEKTKDWCDNYYKRCGADHNSLLRNSEVLFQTLAYDASVIRAMQSIKLDPVNSYILDVGCGEGGSILNFLRLGFDPRKIFGIDIIDQRIKEASKKFPNVNFKVADASCLEFKDDNFDMVFESTMFVQIVDDDVAHRIAKEMLRVVKSGGYILLADWRYSKPGNTSYKGLFPKRISQLFDIGPKTRVFGIHKGSLVPPIGRFLSSKIPCVYFIISALFPFLTGQVTKVLRKI